MTSPTDTLMTLAHMQGGLMIAILVLSTAAGFIAGLLFERASRRSQDDEK